MDANNDVSLEEEYTILLRHVKSTVTPQDLKKAKNLVLSSAKTFFPFVGKDLSCKKTPFINYFAVLV